MKAPKINFNALTILIFVAVLAIIIYCLPRGLDLTDEGFYLSSLYFPDRYPTFYSFGTIYTKLFGWLHPNVLDWRIIKLVQSGVATIVLSYAVYLTSKNKIQTRLYQIFIILFLLNSVSSSLYLQTISYNDLNNFLTVCSIACLGIFISQTEKKPIFLISAGFFEGINFFNKATASASLGILMAVFLVVYFWPNWQKSVRFTLFILLGYALGFLFYFSVFQSFDSWYIDVFEGFNSSSQYMAKPLDWLLEYAYRLGRSFGFIMLVLLPWLIGELFFVRKIIKIIDQKNHQRLTIFCRIISVIWSAFLLYETSLLLGGEKNFSKLSLVYLIVIGFMFLAIIVKQKFDWKQDKQHWIWLFFLFLVPFACGIGSTNSLTRQACFHTIFWGVILIHLDQKLGSKSWRQSLFALLVFIQILSGTYDPYSMSAMNRHIKPVSLWEQSSTLKGIKNLEQIKVDEPTKNSYVALISLIQKHSQQADNQAIFYDLPGLNFLTQTVSPSTSWYYWTYVKYNCHCVAQTNFREKRKPILAFLDSKVPKEEMLNCFQKSGIDFPNQYNQIGAFFMPSHQDTLRVYVGRQRIDLQSKNP